MIDLYAAGTSNGMRARIALEECGLPYQLHPIDLAKGGNKTPEFLKLNPNAQIPVIVDSEGPGGKPLTLSQSTAILLYAAEKSGKFLPRDAAKRPANSPMPRILTVPERMDKGTLIQVGGKNYNAEQVQRALHYQLHERLAFVKPKDPYVADLLYSYALIEANLGVVEGGVGLLSLAREYGFPDEALLSLHKERFESILLFAQIRWWGILTLSILLFILFLYYLHRRKCFSLSFRFFLSSRDYKAHKEAMAKAKATKT